MADIKKGSNPMKLCLNLIEYTRNFYLQAARKSGFTYEDNEEFVDLMEQFFEDRIEEINKSIDEGEYGNVYSKKEMQDALGDLQVDILQRIINSAATIEKDPNYKGKEYNHLMGLIQQSHTRAKSYLNRKENVWQTLKKKRKWQQQSMFLI